MNHILDRVINIPYFTNRTDQLFSWYTIYNDNVIIREINEYSNVNFNLIPKNNIKNFGLYGCGFHLNCDFNTGELSIYGSNSKNKEMLFSIYPSLEENKLLLPNTNILKLNVEKLSPFTFKQFVLDTEFNNNGNKSFINKYYAGYTGLINLSDNINIIFKMYFSLHVFDKPSSIGIIYKFLPYKDTKYQSKIYRFDLTEKMNTIYYDKEKSKQKHITKLIDFEKTFKVYKGKIIFSYR